MLKILLVMFCMVCLALARPKAIHSEEEEEKPDSPCVATFENKGAYILEISQDPAAGEGWKDTLATGKKKEIDLHMAAEVTLTAVAGRSTTCQAAVLCGQIVRCTGTTVIGFECDC